MGIFFAGGDLKKVGSCGENGRIIIVCKKKDFCIEPGYEAL
jgi:hypothetical protein